MENILDTHSHVDRDVHSCNSNSKPIRLCLLFTLPLPTCYNTECGAEDSLTTVSSRSKKLSSVALAFGEEGSFVEGSPGVWNSASIRGVPYHVLKRVRARNFAIVCLCSRGQLRLWGRHNLCKLLCISGPLPASIVATAIVVEDTLLESVSGHRDFSRSAFRERRDAQVLGRLPFSNRKVWNISPPFVCCSWLKYFWANPSGEYWGHGEVCNGYNAFNIPRWWIMMALRGM